MYYPVIIFPALRRTSHGLEIREFKSQREINNFLRIHSGWMRGKEYLDRGEKAKLYRY